MTIRQGKNHLAQETSPYLLQHAENPVDWYPWGELALKKARRENKPILLSIGYAACHWCHVMAHESFEDAVTANLMNQLFVNIKVDREERPDLDKIYQMSYQLLSNGKSGGWPLTVFLNPQDHTPFFAGTYFPKMARYGLPSFSDILQRVHDFYQQHAAELPQQGEQLRQVLQQISEVTTPNNQTLTDEPIVKALQQLRKNFDAQYGGFYGAPKFPHPGNLEFLMQQIPLADASDAQQLTYMLELTLSKMAHGGIFDQLGGGFFRYSVDAQWQIPHFEKMLYDNAQLLFLYSKIPPARWRSPTPFFKGGEVSPFAAPVMKEGEVKFTPFRKGGRERSERGDFAIANATADWVLREMAAAEGGYYSSLSNYQLVEGNLLK